MGLFRAPEPVFQKRQKRSRLSFPIFLLCVYFAVKLLGSAHPLIFMPAHTRVQRPLPILTATPDNEKPLPQIYHFTGTRLRGNGTYLDLGDRRTHLPGSLLARYFPQELILPSCLTQPTPPLPGIDQPAPKPLPVRDEWPGFYGAPWVAHSNGNLIALLHVSAPRDTGSPVIPPEFQIYANYDGQQNSPDFDSQAPATFQRGSKAVLYRVFLNGPVRCLDLVVQNGENNGIGHLYYQKYHHYYEMDTTFRIQP